MAQFTLEEALQMQRQLQEKYRDIWEPIGPETAKNKLRWMLGEAGEVTLQFKTEDGVMVLHGASNKITLTVYDAAGELKYTLPLDTVEERAAVPQEVRERLQRLR